MNKFIGFNQWVYGPLTLRNILPLVNLNQELRAFLYSTCKLDLVFPHIYVLLFMYLHIFLYVYDTLLFAALSGLLYILHTPGNK